MRCAWKELLGILPPWLRQNVDRQGKTDLQELRLRLGLPPELVTARGSFLLDRAVSGDDLHFCINTASRYSPWAAATAAQGYITAPGGHRIGLCGEASVRDGVMTGIRNPTSLCIRVARDLPDPRPPRQRKDHAAAGPNPAAFGCGPRKRCGGGRAGRAVPGGDFRKLLSHRAKDRCSHRLRKRGGDRPGIADYGPFHHWGG